MTAPEISSVHTAYQNLKPMLEPLRTVIASGYALVALADFYCEVTGRYVKAGVKPLRMVYLESRPLASALTWLCLHGIMVASMVNGYGRWWQPALFMLGFGAFLGGRVYRARTFLPGLE